MPQNQSPESGQDNGKKPIPFKPDAGRDELAHQIAKTFGDEVHLPMYHFFTRKYGEELVTKAFEEAKSVPSEKIKKSRPALFIFLLRKYAKQKED